jgi:predicted phosphoadenosine phosphosulfate sulfurtransferase
MEKTECDKFKPRVLPVTKRPIGVSVLEAARQRIADAFDSCEKVYVSFSAGKDSTVMLHMVADEARARGRRFGVLLVDLEAQYKLTINHAEKCRDMCSDCSDWYWLCLPIHLRNAVSMYQPQWVCWDADAKKIWVREPPGGAITDPLFFDWFVPGMEFEEAVPAFAAWYSGGKKTACLVGIRSDESLNRFRTIASKKKERLGDKCYTTLVCDNVYNFYPIYDWRTEDLWLWHARNPGRPHNKLYDLMHKAGLTIHQMRICQPYGDDQRRGLWLYHIIEPETWGKVVARVNGANSGSLYIQESGNMTGYRSVTLPPGHTWRSFAELLLSSLPEKTAQHFRAKVDVHRKWWMDRGYESGIPDAADPKLEAKREAPSWRRVCKSILRNDYWCKGLGFTQHRTGHFDSYLKMMERRKQRPEWKIDEREKQGALFGGAA